MSDTQVRVGTMTSPGPKVSRSAVIVSRLAEAPELTKTLCLTPSQADHSFSKRRTWWAWVSFGLSCERNAMRASTSGRVMLFCISGQSRDACGAAGLGATGLLFAIVVAILNHDGALAVVSLHGPLVGRKDLFGFIQSDDLDVPAHQTESLSEVADMLVLRMQRAHRADAGADNHFGPVAAAGHERELVEVIDHLIGGQQQEVPPRENAHRHLPGERQPAGHPHLQLFGHRQFEQF